MDTFIKSDTAVFRKVDEEVIVVQLESGRFFYFGANMEPVLNELVEPRRVDLSSEDAVGLRAMFDWLERERIVTRVETAESMPLSLPSEVPALLRQGETGLDGFPSVMMIMAPPPPS